MNEYLSNTYFFKLNFGESMSKLLRVRDIVKVNKNSTNFYLPISRSSWLKGVSEGKYPQPIKLSTRVTCWRESDVLALMQ